MQSAENITCKDFLESAKFLPVVDVRAPIEFENGHIPGAVNIPLFENHERAEIGTIYKLRGKEDAVLRGLELVSPKLADFIRSVKNLKGAGAGKVLVYCFRGGMRSNSFASLLLTAGIDAKVLRGGYKSYRKQVLDYYENELKLVILGGATGSGKTEILEALKKSGEQVIDLEALAHHKGSAFGFIGQHAQPAQQEFENRLQLAFSKLDLSKNIWLEDESFSIGKVKLPYPLWQQMKKAPIVKVHVPIDIRVKRLVSEYGSADKELLKEIVLKIQKRLGGLLTQQALELLEKGDYEKVTRVLLQYYDSAYSHDHTKRENQNIFKVIADSENMVRNAQTVLNFYRNNIDEVNSVQ